MKINKDLLIFFISAIALIASIFLIQQSLLQKQDQALTNQDTLFNTSKEIIDKININTENRSNQLKQFVKEVNDNMTSELLKNRDFIQNLTSKIQQDLDEHEIQDEQRFFNYTGNTSKFKINASITRN